MAVFTCRACGFFKEVPDKLIGRKAKCPECGKGTAVEEMPSDETEVLADVVTTPSLEGNEQPLPESIEDIAGATDLKDNVAAYASDDIVCSQCGHVVVGELQEGQTTCPECEAPLELPSEEDMPTIDDVDAAELAKSVDTGPDVWEEDYEASDSSFVISDDDKKPAVFLAGGVFSNLYSGLISGILALFFGLSFALLIPAQTGEIRQYPIFVFMTLVSFAAGGLLHSMRSRAPYSLAGIDAIQAGVLFLFIGSVYRDLEPNFTSDVVLATTVAAMITATAFVGLTMFVVGKIKVGRAMRFIPIQIVGGVMGGVGVFILMGALGMMGPPTWVDKANFTTVYMFIGSFPMPPLHMWLPGAILGGLLLLLFWRRANTLTMVAVLFVAIGLGQFANLWGPMVGLGKEVSHLGTHLPTGPMVWEALSFDLVSRVHWPTLVENNLYIGCLVVLTILTTMHRISTFEGETQRDVDIDDEYRSLGISGVFSALLGGAPVVVSLERSLGNYRLGGQGRLSGLVAALVCLVGIALGNHLLVMVPRFVCEGLVVFFGFNIVRNWVFKSKNVFTRKEDILLLTIAFLGTVAFGLMVGVGLGAAVALTVTVSRYSLTGPVKYEVSGVTYRSNVDRAPAQLRLMQELGDHVHVMRIQGFVFLGTMHELFNRIRKRLDDRELLPLQYLILDFHDVSGLASTAGIGFSRLRDLAYDRNLNIIFTHASLELEEMLEASGFAINDLEGSFKMFMNLDYALEWCEDRILEQEGLLDIEKMTLPQLLGPVFPVPKYIPALMKVMKKMYFSKGEVVIQQGDAADCMYFVEQGRLDVELEIGGGRIMRLKKVGPGAVFGEMGIYTNAKRSATVRAAEKCSLYRLTRTKLKQIEKRAPALVSAIDHYLISLMSDRVVEANRKARELM